MLIRKDKRDTNSAEFEEVKPKYRAKGDSEGRRLPATEPGSH